LTNILSDVILYIEYIESMVIIVDNKNKKVKLYGTIVGVFLFVLLILGFSYAYLSWISDPVSIVGNTECFNVNFTKGSNISSSNIKLYDESIIIDNNIITMKSDMTYTNFSVNLKDECDIDAYLIVNLTVNSLDDTFISGSNNGAFKYVIAEYPTGTDISNVDGLGLSIVRKGIINSTGKREVMQVKLPMDGTNKNYVIIFYIDGDLVDNTAVDHSFSASLETIASQGKVTGVNYVSNLFTPDSTVTNFGVDYKYDTTDYLMEDIAGNIRYYGATPKNYIYFNCSDYSDQSSSTCEVWRIIGVFDGKLKLIRGSDLGGYSWDTSASDVNSGYSINEWSQADLMKLLNPGYENNQDLDTNGNTITVNNSLYWTGAQAASSGTCYNDSSNRTITCDFRSTGLKNDKTRNLISEHTYYLGGTYGMAIDSRLSYVIERGQAVHPNPSDGVTRTTEWPGKIAFAYPSDYGYAADLSQCQQYLSAYDNSTCTSNNWMKSLCSGYYWLLTPDSTSEVPVWTVNSSGAVNMRLAFYASGVLPVLYLNSDVSIGVGDGSSNTPYQLVVY